jgi:hypothetical protein
MPGENHPEQSSDSNQSLPINRRRFMAIAGVVASGTVFGAETVGATESHGQDGPTVPDGVSVARTTVTSSTVSTDSVPKVAEGETAATKPVPRGLPVSDEAYHHLKKRAKRGELPQPPANAVQRVETTRGDDA